MIRIPLKYMRPEPGTETPTANLRVRSEIAIVKGTATPVQNEVTPVEPKKPTFNLKKKYTDKGDILRILGGTDGK